MKNETLNAPAVASAAAGSRCENIDGKCDALRCNCEERRKQSRYAEGWCAGEYFCIQVAPRETFKQLKKHFRETVGHDRIQIRRWHWVANAEQNGPPAKLTG